MGKETSKSSERVDEPPSPLPQFSLAPGPRQFCGGSNRSHQPKLFSLSVLTMFGPDMTIVEVKQFVARQKMGDPGSQKVLGR